MGLFITCRLGIFLATVVGGHSARLESKLVSETTTTTETAGTKVVQFDGNIENAYGRPLKDLKFKDGFTPVIAIAFNAEYEHVKTYDAIPAKEMPDKDDVLAVVNQARKANARQKATQTALDNAGVIKPTMEEDPALQLKSMVAGMVAAKDAQGNKRYTEESATKLAKQILGIE